MRKHGGKARARKELVDSFVFRMQILAVAKMRADEFRRGIEDQILRSCGVPVYTMGSVRPVKIISTGDITI